MADSPSNRETQEGSDPPLARRIAERRRAAVEFSTAQRESLVDLEARIDAELNRVAESLAKERAEKEQADAARESIAHETQSLEEKSAELARREESLAARQGELDARQAELEARQAEIDRLQQDRDESARQQQTALEQARHHLDQQAAEIARHTEDLERKESDLADREEALRAAQQEFDDKQIEASAAKSANETASAEQIATLSADLEAARTDLEAVQAGLEAARTELDSSRAERDAARAELALRDEQPDAAAAEAEQLRREVEEKSQALAAAEARLEKLTAENASLQDCVNEAADRLQGDAPDTAELAALTEVRDAAIERCESLAEQIRNLEQRCEEAERQAAAPAAEGGEELDDLKRRYEMAMDDLRDLKRRNAELESRAANNGPATDASGDGGLDWEAQKQRLLAQLDEIDEQDETEEERADRLKIEDVIRKTDAAIATKERELGDMRQLLEEQSNNLGEMAVGAAALGQLFDTDEIVKQERERLAQLQGEWEAKLRDAEIEISVERAKIARERNELEERLQKLEQERAREQAAKSADDEPKSKGGSRGRWLSRLGLKEQDE